VLLQVAAELAFLLTNGSNAAPPSVVLNGHAQPVRPPFLLAGHSAGSFCMRQYISVCEYVCVYTYICICIYIRMYIHTCTSAGSIYMRQFAMDFPALTAGIVSFDGLPVLGDGPLGEEAYRSDLQEFFPRDILWMFAAFLHPLGLAHAFFPVFEMWYLPGVNKTLDKYETMMANYFKTGTFSSMMQVDVATSASVL